MIGFDCIADGGDLVIQKLHALPDGLKEVAIPEAIRAMLKSGMNEATRLLSGSKSSPVGSYPVPVRTGFLRQSEDVIFPGQTKAGLSAGLFEGYLVNTAVYASVIGEGRPFQDDAMPEESLPWYLDAEINRLTQAMEM